MLSQNRVATSIAFAVAFACGCYLSVMKSRRDLPTETQADASKKLITEVGDTDPQTNSEHHLEHQEKQEPRIPIGNMADFDADKNGFIDPHEAVKLARSLGLNSALPVETLKKGSLLIDKIDTDRDSKISPDEFKAGYAALADVTWLSA